MSTSAPEPLALPGARLLVWRRFLAPSEAEELFEWVLASLDWQQRNIHLFGRPIPEPRLTAWYGDPSAQYRYSGRDNVPLPWPVPLELVRERVAATTGGTFNSVLANLYRDGHDHLGWHSDDEPELGAAPKIASLSLGAVRKFQLRPRPRGRIALELLSTPGSLLLMSGQTQRNYQHQVPATARPVGPRVNLTFRNVSPVADTVGP